MFLKDWKNKTQRDLIFVGKNSETQKKWQRKKKLKKKERKKERKKNFKRVQKRKKDISEKFYCLKKCFRLFKWVFKKFF